MVSALVSRCAMLVFGTLYPAYRSYKAVRSKDVREYVKWMMYWITFALFQAMETLADIFLSFWLPFYYELKILFIFWLLSPYTRGASYLYRRIVHPLLNRHENDIDACIDQIRKNSYSVLMQMGNRGFFYAREVVSTAALRSQQQLMNQLQKSSSLNALQEAADGVDGEELAMRSGGEDGGLSTLPQKRASVHLGGKQQPPKKQPSLVDERDETFERLEVNEVEEEDDEEYEPSSRIRVKSSNSTSSTGVVTRARSRGAAQDDDNSFVSYGTYPRAAAARF